MTVGRIAHSLYALRFTDEFIPWFPLYAVYMLHSGLTPGELASLFLIWSVTAFALEIPSGAWADAFSRRKLIALGSALRGVGFLLWTVWPAYWGFALGFVLWGVRSAMKSGAVEALVYDELAVAGHSGSYLRIVGRGHAVSVAAMMTATALGTPIFFFGGYELAGWLSVAVSLAGTVAALRLPETTTPNPPSTASRPSGVARYLAQLRAGAGEARRHRALRQVLVLAIGMGGLTAFDEFLPLLLADLGTSTVAVPLLLLLPAAAMAVAAAFADRFRALPAGPAALLLLAAAAMVGFGPSTGRPLTAMLMLALAFGGCQIIRLVVEARLQSVIATGARATVLSVAGFGAELLAVTVYFGYGLGSRWLPATALIALFAVPLLAVAALTFRWLPADHAQPAAATS